MPSQEAVWIWLLEKKLQCNICNSEGAISETKVPGKLPKKRKAELRGVIREGGPLVHQPQNCHHGLAVTLKFQTENFICLTLEVS